MITGRFGIRNRSPLRGMRNGRTVYVLISNEPARTGIGIVNLLDRNIEVIGVFTSEQDARNYMGPNRLGRNWTIHETVIHVSRQLDTFHPEIYS